MKCLHNLTGKLGLNEIIFLEKFAKLELQTTTRFHFRMNVDSLFFGLSGFAKGNIVGQEIKLPENRTVKPQPPLYSFSPPLFAHFCF